MSQLQQSLTIIDYVKILGIFLLGLIFVSGDGTNINHYEFEIGKNLLKLLVYLLALVFFKLVGELFAEFNYDRSIGPKEKEEMN